MNPNLITEPTVPPELISDWADVLIRTAWRSIDRMEATISHAEEKLGAVRMALKQRRDKATAFNLADYIK